jgi:hypothetical protein
MHERLSASTDLRPVKPEVARDNKGLGSARAGISGEFKVAFSCGSGGKGADCDSLRFIPSTNARKLSSRGDGGIPCWGWRVYGEAVGEEEEETALGRSVAVDFMGNCSKVDVVGATNDRNGGGG